MFWICADSLSKNKNVLDVFGCVLCFFRTAIDCTVNVGNIYKFQGNLSEVPDSESGKAAV